MDPRLCGTAQQCYPCDAICSSGTMVPSSTQRAAMRAPDGTMYRSSVTVLWGGAPLRRILPTQGVASQAAETLTTSGVLQGLCLCNCQTPRCTSSSGTLLLARSCLLCTPRKTTQVRCAPLPGLCLGHRSRWLLTCQLGDLQQR
jgi:hypothetical protein